MKIRPTLLMAVAIILVTGFSSCVRDYTCTCTIKYSGQPGLPDSVVTDYPVRDTKKKAKSLCEGNSFTTDKNGIHTDENCHLY